MIEFIELCYSLWNNILLAIPSPLYGDEKEILREKERANRISIFTKIVTMEEYLESTKDIILCRESLIVRLYSLIGRENEPLPDSIFVYGHMATGKSFIVRNLLEYLRYNVSYINCMEYLGNRHMYNYILDDLIAQSTEKSCSNALLKRNCDNILDFILALKMISLNNDKRPIVLVFDMCHKIRDIDVTFLPAILKLRELSAINVCTILISNIAWEKFRSTLGTLEPIKIHFPQYMKDEFVQLLLLYRPAMHYDIYFYKNYLNLFLSVFFRFCRDLNELRYMAELNFVKYIEPIENKRIEQDNIAALWRNISLILKSNLEVIYLRVSMGHFSQPENDRVSREIESTTKLALSFELPFYAKYILIAAYLASHNPAKNDKRIFAKRDIKKREKIRSNKKLVKQVDCLKKPRIFTISRMLAIFCCIIDENIDINANILAQVSTMCQLGLLVAAGGDNILQLDEPKFKCCASYDFVTVIAKTVGFHIMNYLSVNID